MAFFDKFKEVADNVKNKVNEIMEENQVNDKLNTLKDSVKKTWDESSAVVKATAEEVSNLKQPVAGAIIRYDVLYVSGLPQYPKARNGSAIGLNVLPEKFVLTKTGTSKDWFEDFDIPYSAIQELTIEKREVPVPQEPEAEGETPAEKDETPAEKDETLAEKGETPAEKGETPASEGETPVDGNETPAVAAEPLMREVDGYVCIRYLAEDGTELMLRTQMFTGLTPDGQAEKCGEFLGVLDQYGIPKKFGVVPALESAPQPDILGQIEKMAQLRDAGILTEEEFTQKKAELLQKL